VQAQVCHSQAAYLSLGMFLPPHNVELLIGLSHDISIKVPQFTFDIIGAFLEYFHSYTLPQKEYGVLYIRPWITQLEARMQTGAEDFDEITKEIKSILRAFIRLTHEKPQVWTIVSQCNNY
jgi:hypothetical protein